MVAKINWDDTWTLGVDVIDDQHKFLIDLVNKVLTEDIKTQTLIRKLIEYTAWHFADEERLMFENDYNGAEYKAHKKEHEDSKKALLEISFALVNSGDPELPHKFRQFFLDWFSLHFLRTDKAFADYLKEDKK